MFHKNVQKSLSAVLLVLLAGLLLFPMSVIADSTGSETRSLTVDFELDQCAVEAWFYNDAGVPESKIPLEKGVKLNIPYGKRNVEVKVIPSPGYVVESFYKVNPDGSLDGPWTKWSTDQFNTDVTLQIKCKQKTFSVEFVAEENQPVISYYFASEVAGKYTNLSFTYKVDTIVIDPVVKTSGGYTFKGWEMVYEENGILIAKPLSKNSEGDWILPADVMIQDQWQADGKIYLRPVFSPNEYPVWWYDYEITVPGDYDAKELLASPYQTIAPMGSDVDGAVNTDIYPGYIFDKYISYPVDVDESEGGSAKVNKIYRYFNPIYYQLNYEYANGTLILPEGSTEAKEHIYNQDTLLPAVSRVGYAFMGWEVLVNGEVVDTIPVSDAMKLSARKEAYALGNDGEALTLRAIWEANKYGVEYDLGGADPAENAFLPTQYAYDSALKIPSPVRRGYEFLGWSVNGSSELISDLTLTAESYLDTVQLVAVWKAMEFEVVLDSNGGTPEGGLTLPDKVTYDAPLSINGVVLPKRSQYKFLGFYYGDACYIHADGTSACEQWDLVSEDGSSVIVLKAKWELLPAIEVDLGSYQIDYKNEKFQFPTGSYRVTLEGVTVEFTVDADGMGAKKIPEEFFGKTVTLTVCTFDDTLYSDYHGTLVIAARPEAPTRENNVIDQVFSTNTTIQVLFKEGIDSSLYETALYLDGKSVVAWGDTLVFDGLKEGTSYVVLVRVKATDTAPCSLSTQFERDTDSKGFKESLRKELDALIQPGDGEMVNSLISQAKNAIEELTHSPTFYEDARKIVEDAAAAVQFARRQDQRITDLRSYHDALLDTKAYSQANQALIRSILEDAERKLRTATDDAAVQAIYESAYQEMARIRITYLRNEEVFITSENGLPKDYTFTLVRHPDFTTQADQVNSAIAAGKVLGFGGNSPADLIRLLKTQDVMAAYTMSLSGTEYSGVFKVTLHLPAELRGVNGLRVAYFDKATGTLEVLETEVEGDYLVFYAERISDFVILGDPVLNLLVPMIALFIVVLCQILAIALILKGRSDSKKAVRHYSFALPMALTVQFLPKHGEWIVLILGALVILLQIVLTVLLLKSELIHKKRLTRGAYRPVEEPAEPVMADAEELYEAPAVEDAVYGETAPEAESFAEDSEPFYYASVNTETEFEEERGEEEPVFYSMDPDTGELYEDPYGNYVETPVLSEESEDAFLEASVREEMPEEDDGVYTVSEDAEPVFFAFDDEDVVYGDPAEPPYEDDAVSDEPEKTEFDIG